jgi:TRAP-type C4-dicarboxylate transport system substrate-binding protein
MLCVALGTAVLVSWIVSFTCPLSASAAETKIVVKLAGTLPMQGYMTKALYMYQDIVEKKAAGRVAFQVYPAGQLYAEKDLVTALPAGAVDGVLISPDFWGGLVRSEGILYFSCYFPSREKFYKIWDSEAGQIISREFEEKANMKILGVAEYGAMALLTKKPIRKLEDFKGMRIRANGEYIAVFLRALGAAPVVTSAGDAYIMLQRGTIDGSVSTPISFVDRKWYEVAKCFLQTPTHVSSVFLLGFNLDFYKKLPADLQKVFADAGVEVQEWTRTQADSEHARATKILKDMKLTFTQYDTKEWERWREVAGPELEANYKKNVGEEMGQKIIDIVKKTCF